MTMLRLGRSWLLGAGWGIAVMLAAGAAPASPDEDANRLFVEAAGLAEKAAVVSDPAERYELLVRARDNLIRLTGEYPQTSVAVRVVSGDRIGRYTRTELLTAVTEASGAAVVCRKLATPECRRAFMLDTARKSRPELFTTFSVAAALDQVKSGDGEALRQEGLADRNRAAAPLLQASRPYFELILRHRGADAAVAFVNRLPGLLGEPTAENATFLQQTFAGLIDPLQHGELLIAFVRAIPRPEDRTALADKVLSDLRSYQNAQPAGIWAVKEAMLPFASPARRQEVGDDRLSLASPRDLWTALQGVSADERNRLIKEAISHSWQGLRGAEALPLLADGEKTGIGLSFVVDAYLELAFAANVDDRTNSRQALQRARNLAARISSPNDAQKEAIARVNLAARLLDTEFKPDQVRTLIRAVAANPSVRESFVACYFMSEWLSKYGNPNLTVLIFEACGDLYGAIPEEYFAMRSLSLTQLFYRLIDDQPDTVHQIVRVLERQPWWSEVPADRASWFVYTGDMSALQRYISAPGLREEDRREIYQKALYYSIRHDLPEAVMLWDKVDKDSYAIGIPFGGRGRLTEANERFYARLLRERPAEVAAYFEGKARTAADLVFLSVARPAELAILIPHFKNPFLRYYAFAELAVWRSTALKAANWESAWNFAADDRSVARAMAITLAADTMARSYPEAVRAP